MSAHNSILAVRVIQTRDTNKKRQYLTFKMGDLAYLSSKNVSFPKGLACKLIPKYLGPYKIIQDFGNASFKLELPQHLKQQGVHNVFHSSLLRIHVPNDNRLFPGHMDTQVVGDNPLDDKWAVECIKSHSRSKTDAIFQVLWKLGDVTWLPYYQITHLQALTDYFELIGVSQVAKLPNGHGQPPSDDPQIFLGSILVGQPASRFLTCPSFIIPLSYLRPITFNLSSFLHSLLSLPVTTPPFSSPSLDLNVLIIMPKVHTVNHPFFKRISVTHYQIREPNNSLNSTVHVRQITNYIKFDKQLQLHGGISQLQSMPLGFPSFTDLWNRSTHNSKQLSRVYLPDYSDKYQVNIYNNPINLNDFHITAEQVGLAPPTPDLSSSINREITQEFATIMMEQQRNSRQGFENHQDHWLCPFNQGPASQPKAVLSWLQFQHKSWRSCPSISIKRSPSPMPSEVSQPNKELEEFADKSALPPVEEPVEMAISN